MHTTAVLAYASVLFVGVCGLLNSQKNRTRFKEKDGEKDKGRARGDKLRERDTATMPE